MSRYFTLIIIIVFSFLASDADTEAEDYDEPSDVPYEWPCAVSITPTYNSLSHVTECFYHLPSDQYYEAISNTTEYRRCSVANMVRHYFCAISVYIFV